MKLLRARMNEVHAADHVNDTLLECPDSLYNSLHNIHCEKDLQHNRHIVQIVLWTLIFLCLSSCTHPTPALACNNWKRHSFSTSEEKYFNKLADAIRRAENSKKYPYGIIAKKRLTENEARKYCVNTIKHRYHSYIPSVSQDKSFIHFLSKTYAPIGASNDPTGLNRNWINNVSYFMGVNHGDI